MESYEISVVRCEIGSILIYTSSDVCHKIEFSNEILPEVGHNIFTTQIKEYLNKKRQKLDFPIFYNTGPIFNTVWRYLGENVRYGTIITYGQLARMCATTPKVIGYAMASNPLPIYIPCHRVVGKNNIGGFGGKNRRADLIKWKEYLLSLEGCI
ncbi:MAG: methylated-DNA--[protein]-cysteine S-methyltransferase [Fervidobacterium sp.]|nr:methylated-DNA--[protein]-cysteine S-methyltransferase [Fervidobacterium sp.]